MEAVDYVVKPFSPTELAARVRAALRKRAASEPSEPYVLGDLTIDYAERRVSLASRPLPLIAMEYRLLAELSANARAAVDLRASAGTGPGREEQRRRAAHAHHRKQAPPQAGRRRGQSHLHLHRASRRLQDAKGRDEGTGGGDVNHHSAVIYYSMAS